MAAYYVVSSPTPATEAAGPSLPLASVPSVGRLDDEVVGFSLDHSAVAAGRLGDRVQWAAEVSVVLDGGEYRLNRQDWRSRPQPEPSTAADGTPFSGFSVFVDTVAIKAVQEETEGAYKPAEHRLYRFTFEIRRLASFPALEMTKLLECLPAIDLSATPFDVRLFFPNVREGGAELWAESQFLAKASPYFATLLGSEFLESSVRHTKRPRLVEREAVAGPASSEDYKDFDDSDDETDELYFKTMPSLQHEHEGDCPLEYKQITIPHTAFTTYRAVLAYLRTGTIVFAPLTSSSQAHYQGGASRFDNLPDRIRTNRPFPTSPKLAYRLAHLLELESLQEMCLAQLGRFLTVDNAPAELVDDASLCFAPWRKVIIDFIVKNGDGVTKSVSWMRLQRAIEAGEMPHSAPVLLELFNRQRAAAKA
ncbi:hypothetical protein NBRC10512_001472 [Rhodotorula toruloides]